MNSFINSASTFGYEADKILKFLSRNYPKFGDKLKQAFAAGYTADEVLNVLNRSSPRRKSKNLLAESGETRAFTDEPGRLTEQQRQQKAIKKSKRQDVLSQALDPRNVLSTAIGAGLGYMRGGPAGAVAGGFGGAAAYDDLIKKYEERVAAGSDMSFFDFVKMMAKAAAKGVAVGYSVEQLNSLLNSLNPNKSGETIDVEGEIIEPQTPQIEMQSPQQKGEPIPEEPPAPIEPEAPIQTAEQEKTPEKSYKYFEDRGISSILDALAQNVSPIEGVSAIRKLWGNEYIKDIERLFKRPAEEVIEEAFEYSLQKTRKKESEKPQNIAEIGKLGGGIVDSFYKQAFDSLQKGKTEMAGIEDPFLKFAKPYFDKGQIKSPQDLQKIEKVYQKKKTTTPPKTTVETDKMEEVEGENFPTTGKPYTMEFVRNTQSSPQLGSRFGQDIEPAGRYMSEGKAEHVKNMPNMISGKITFENPLVLDWGDGYGEEGNWKNVLSKKYNGKKGKNLSQAIRNDGFDGIITVEQDKRGNKYTSEIVDLTSFKPSTKEKKSKQPEIKQEPTKQKSTPKEPGDPRYEAFRDIFQNKPLPSSESSRKIQPISDALKSSNVRGAFYNADTQKMRVVFKPKKGSNQPAAVYTYDNVDKSTFKKLVGGKAKPVTEGSNDFGIWFSGKNKSIGAAFDQRIKKQADKFPYKQVPKENYTLKEQQISDADRTFLVSQIFEPFKQLHDRGKALSAGTSLKEVVPALQEVDDELLADMVQYIVDKAKLKNFPTISRLKKDLEKEFLNG